MATTRFSYSIVQVRKIIEYLNQWMDDARGMIETEEEKDNPNEDRVSTLEARIDALDSASEALGWLE